MKEQTLYTFGYLSGKSTRILTELIAVKTPIVDVRYNPTSKRYEWTQEPLQKKLGTAYTWIPELGNEWYREALNGSYTEPHVKLHNPTIGLARLQEIVDEYGRVAIFCACSSPKHCHRTVVATLAMENIQGLKVVHL